MLNIIAEAKKYQLANGLVVVVNRVNVRDYYMLMVSLFIYKKALINLVGIENITKTNEYINYTKEHSIDIAMIKVEMENIKTLLKNIVDVDIEKQEQNVIFEILNCVVDFNSISLSYEGKELASLTELNEELEIKLGIVCSILKKPIQEVLEMPNYDATILVRENNRQRVNYINDVRLAYHGDKINYVKYTRGLMGEVVYSGEEIYNDPTLLNKVVH